ncbi:MAG: carbohydrate binding family 9 domain-containing protein [Verrucomicrobiales bacterium]|nr:carbohydrate binding family 9 domain-containing protein [Verrucomicrobiales bacterium]
MCAIFIVASVAAANHVERIGVVKISEEEKPKIDGDLSDEVWKKAAVVENLTQMYPVEQVAPSERTEVRICYDSKNLYFAFHCFDSGKVNASIMQRDQNVGGADDYVFISLDPYQTGREGFYFRLNANGAKGDGRITAQSSKPNMNWDAIWKGAGKLTEDGWSVEFAIPFRSVSFDRNSTVWNVNFGRWMPRLQERSRWSGAYRQRNFLKFEDAGKLTGLKAMERGLGVDVKPYALARQKRGRFGDGIETDYGADVFYQVTPSLTTTLTWNTDFAETEVDDRVVNLTRFPLFFPEKRDFFLEGQEYFEFGPFSKSLLPFHSRTIGLSDTREKVPIIGGAKVTGRVGKVGVGMFGTRLDETDTLFQDDVGVARLTYDVLEESRIGTFFSHGDPRGNGENFVAGVDFDFKDSHWKSSENEVSLKAYDLMSRDAGTDAHAFGASFQYPNEPLRITASVRQIDEEFQPGMGFVRRPGTRRGQSLVQHEFYPTADWLREIRLGTNVELTTNLDNQVESAEYSPINFKADFESGDEFFIYPEMRREVLFRPFEIADDVVISEGNYYFNTVYTGIETASKRPVDLDVGARFGNFWSGERWGVEADVEWRQSRYFGIETGIEFDAIDLPEGEFEVLIGYAGFRVTPNPKFSWNTLAQWDSVSNEIGINSRLRYIVSPGNDIFFVVNKGFLFDDGRSFRHLGSETIAKLGWTFRF